MVWTVSIIASKHPGRFFSASCSVRPLNISLPPLDQRCRHTRKRKRSTPPGNTLSSVRTARHPTLVSKPHRESTKRPSSENGEPRRCALTFRSSGLNSSSTLISMPIVTFESSPGSPSSTSSPSWIVPTSGMPTSSVSLVTWVSHRHSIRRVWPSSLRSMCFSRCP